MQGWGNDGETETIEIPKPIPSHNGGSGALKQMIQLCNKKLSTLAIALHLDTRKSSHNAKKFSTQEQSPPPTYHETRHCTKPTPSGSFESACTSRIPPAESFSRLFGNSLEPRPASSRKSLNFLRIQCRGKTRYDGDRRSHRNRKDLPRGGKGGVKEHAKEERGNRWGTECGVSRANRTTLKGARHAPFGSGTASCSRIPRTDSTHPKPCP